MKIKTFAYWSGDHSVEIYGGELCDCLDITGDKTFLAYTKSGKSKIKSLRLLRVYVKRWFAEVL